MHFPCFIGSDMLTYMLTENSKGTVLARYHSWCYQWICRFIGVWFRSPVQVSTRNMGSIVAYIILEIM